MITKITPNKKKRLSESLYYLIDAVNRMIALSEGIQSFALGKVVSDIERWSHEILTELKAFKDALEVESEVQGLSDIDIPNEVPEDLISKKEQELISKLASVDGDDILEQEIEE